MTSDSLSSSHPRLPGSEGEALLPHSLPLDPLVLSGSIINTVRDPLLVLDKANRVVAASASYYQKFGETSESVLGKSLWEISGGMWRVNTLEELLTQVLRENSTIENFEVRHSFHGLGERILMLNARRVVDSSIDESLTLLAIEDMTARRLAEDRVEQLNRDLTIQNAQLAEANRELETFSYSVSHDLRAPLRSIDGFSLAILEDFGSELNEQMKQHLGRVRNATQLMGRLIDDLLQLSRLSRSDIYLDRVNLSALAQDISRQLLEQNPNREIDCQIEPDMWVTCDRQMMQIGLYNLLSNAFKFTSLKKKAIIKFGVKTINDRPVYFIEDNGAGFDMAYCDKLFNPFQRLHSSHEFPGSGVGLAIVLRVIRRHAGKVWAEGRLGDGATFYFTLF